MEQEELSKRERQKKNREEKKQSEKKDSMFKKFGIIAMIIVAAAGAFWLMYKGGSGTPSTNSPSAAPISVSEVTPADHVKGPENASVTLIEYGDFQCPACGAYHPIVNQIADEFKDSVRLVFRHFPLKQIHRNAEPAAHAAEAAGKQGKFWEMYDVLYEKQSDWSETRNPTSLFKQYASDLGLNVDQFETDMNSKEVADIVNADYNSGLAAGINATPTFYLNGAKVSNPQGLEPFRQLIQTALDQVKTSPSPAGSAMPEASASASPTPESTVSGDIQPSL